MKFKFFLIISLLANLVFAENNIYFHGAIVRGDTTKPALSLVFTGGKYADGGDHIAAVLKKQKVEAGFFFTGEFYEKFPALIKKLVSHGHYLGPHSYDHLLYCAWENRDSTLITQKEFLQDLDKNYEVMKKFGIEREHSPIFLPAYEWYNQDIANWCREENITLINMTHGTLSHTDYTTPSMKRYWSSDTIYQSILEYETSNNSGLNGFILLIHIGTHPEREDKFYYELENLITDLKKRGYEFLRIDELIASPLAKD